MLAPAKINLTLRVFPKREDGYHDLDSVVVPLAFGDGVTVERTERTALEVVPDGVDLGAMPEDPERNLAVRAVRLLERETGRPLPVRIRIVKRIPLGGGLGGGSSDAAAVLRETDRVYGLGLGRARLSELGAELGSDVPLFVADGTVRMTGRGERVERWAMEGAEPLWAVLVNCGCACPTGKVYGAFDADPGAACADNLTLRNDFCDTLRLSLRNGDTDGVARQLVNDLQAPCFSRFPEVARSAQALREAGCGTVLLSGSGATVFALVRSRKEGEKVLSAPALCGFRRVCAQTLPDGVMAAHGPLTPIVMVRIHVGQPGCV